MLLNTCWPTLRIKSVATARGPNQFKATYLENQVDFLVTPSFLCLLYYMQVLHLRHWLRFWACATT